MEGKVFMGDEEVKFMQLARLDDENTKPHRSEFRSLWNGHWKKVTMKMPIYLSASGDAGAVKYIHSRTTEHFGLVMKVYDHCHQRYKPVGIVIHIGEPTLVVTHQIFQSPDLPIKAIAWTFAATGEHAYAKFYFDYEARRSFTSVSQLVQHEGFTSHEPFTSHYIYIYKHVCTRSFYTSGFCAH